MYVQSLVHCVVLWYTQILCLSVTEINVSIEIKTFKLIFASVMAQCCLKQEKGERLKLKSIRAVLKH